jgi:hypothetical protein
MSGGPFRDTLAPLIDEARRQLAELQQRRAALEVRYENARKRLDAKTQQPPPPSPAMREAQELREFAVELRSGALKRPFIAGLIVGLLSWFLIFQQGP